MAFPHSIAIQLLDLIMEIHYIILQMEDTMVVDITVVDITVEHTTAVSIKTG